jgi:hypothetical protein
MPSGLTRHVLDGQRITAWRKFGMDDYSVSVDDPMWDAGTICPSLRHFPEAYPGCLRVRTLLFLKAAAHSIIVRLPALGHGCPLLENDVLYVLDVLVRGRLREFVAVPVFGKRVTLHVYLRTGTGFMWSAHPEPFAPVGVHRK